MSIEKTCENCAMHNTDYQNEYCYVCENETDDHDDFIPREDVVRKDERERIAEKIRKAHYPARNDKFSSSMNFLELMQCLKDE